MGSNLNQRYSIAQKSIWNITKEEKRSLKIPFGRISLWIVLLVAIDLIVARFHSYSILHFQRSCLRWCHLCFVWAVSSDRTLCHPFPIVLVHHKTHFHRHRMLSNLPDLNEQTTNESHYWQVFKLQNNVKMDNYLDDDDELPLPDENVAGLIVRPSPAAVAFDRARVVASSTICVLDFQQFEGSHCKPAKGQ